MNFEKLSEVLQTVQRIVYSELDAYGTGVESIKLEHTTDPEDGSIHWIISMDVVMRQPVRRPDLSKVIKLIHVVYPDLSGVGLDVSVLNF